MHTTKEGLRHMNKRFTKLAVALVASAGLIGAAGTSLAASGVTTTPRVYYGCVKTSGTPVRVLWNVHTAPVTCPLGSFGVHWNQTGPQGIQGAPGSDAIQSVQASTVLSDWPEGSGWANDNFNRSVTITRQHAASASDCGATATSCWFYTETLADNGTFTTVSGHASPNTSSIDTIGGAWTGSIVGGGKLEFYASSSTPNPALVPGTANGSAPPSGTTGWYKLFFPGGTQFGLTSGANVPWLTYDWEYDATITCGSSTTSHQHWSDSINPGDDGQGVTDGNITGTTGC